MAIDDSNYDVDLSSYPILDNEEDNDDFFAPVDPVTTTEPTPDPIVVEEEDNIFKEQPTNEIINELLIQKGIQDPTKIQFENEDGVIEEVDFNSLTKEEQLSILTENPELNEEPEITDSEIEVLNFLRENNLSFEDVLEYERQKAVDEYITSNQEQTYTVDDLTNEELYRYDLQSRYPNLTEEELDAEIAKELQQPDLFTKKSDALREEYKGLEDAEQAELAEQKTQEDEQTYNDLIETMVKVAEDTTDLYSLDLEEGDKEEVLAFLLDRDLNGQSEFAKLLNNPEELFKLAWFAVKGNEAFEVTHDYYKKEIDAVRKQGSIQPTRTVTKNPKVEDENPYGIKW